MSPIELLVGGYTVWKTEKLTVTLTLGFYLLDPCILGKMLGANGGKLTFWPPQPQEPLVPWGQAIKPSSLASWLQDALGLKEIR